LGVSQRRTTWGAKKRGGWCKRISRCQRKLLKQRALGTIFEGQPTGGTRKMLNRPTNPRTGKGQFKNFDGFGKWKGVRVAQRVGMVPT